MWLQLEPSSLFPKKITILQWGSVDGSMRLGLTKFRSKCGTYLSSMMQTMLSPQGKRAPILAVLDLEKIDDLQTKPFIQIFSLCCRQESIYTISEVRQHTHLASKHSSRERIRWLKNFPFGSNKIVEVKISKTKLNSSKHFTFTIFSYTYKQCCGSMTFWCGSGSADPCLWLMDPDADPDHFQR
jgi:hypothetical protein